MSQIDITSTTFLQTVVGYVPEIAMLNPRVATRTIGYVSILNQVKKICRQSTTIQWIGPISGSDQYTVKLEGAAPVGYRAFTIAGARDPALIRHLDDMQRSVRATVEGAMADDLAPEDFTLRFIRYGLDGVMGALEPPRPSPPHEVGLLIEAVAPEQEMASRIVALARSTALHQHFEGRKTTAGNLAFPFSPSDFAAGPVYEFRVYHLMAIDDEAALFPVEIEEVGV